MKTLFVTGGAPWPTTSGVNQRTHLFHRALSAQGETGLVIVSAYVSPNAETETVLRDQFGLRAILRPHKKQALSLLTRGIGNFDLSYLRPDPAIASRIRDVIEEEGPDQVVFRYARSALAADAATLPVPYLLDADDLDLQVFTTRMQAATGLTRLRRALALQMVRRALGPILTGARHIWVASPNDLSYLSHPSVTVLPNIPFGVPENTAPPDPNRTSQLCAIVASCRHRPNVEGIDAFVCGPDAPWARLRARVPEASLHIAGFGMDDAQKARWGAEPGVTALGQLEDLAELYGAADLALVPIAEGGGTKIKVLEALAYARPTVAYAHAARGLDAIGPAEESGLFRAETADALIETATDLLQAPARRAALAAKGQALVLAAFSSDSFATRVAADLSKARASVSAEEER